MITNLFSTSQANRPNSLVFWIITLALLAGLVISILSWLEICVQHCAANQNYHLFGLPFSITGMTFFSFLFLSQLLSLRYSFFTKIVGIGLALAVGSEVMFMLIQKYQIGRWCPVCLSIAVSVFIAAIVYASSYIKSFYLTIKKGNRSDIMNKIGTFLKSFSLVILGFLFAFIGVTKINPAEAAQEEIKNRIVFGVPNSNIEIYIISDWFCGACRRMEPLIEKLLPEIKTETSFYFIDFPVHRKSLNFSPYNLAFLMNDKQHYFHARQMLFELAETTDNPTEEEVTKAAQAEKITFKPLSFMDIKTGLDYFDSVIRKFDVGATPTIIVTNTKNKKVVKLEGSNEISEDKIFKALKTVKKK